MPDLIVHVEVHADDMERAQHFYSEVFGWAWATCCSVSSRSPAMAD